MRLFISLLVFQLLFGAVRAQTIRMEDCVEAAISQNPVTRNLELIKTSLDQQRQILQLNYLPSLKMNASGNYQSDVLGFDLGVSIPGLSLPEMPHFQFKHTVEASQLIYDGGFLRKQQEVNELEGHIQETEIRKRQFEIKVLAENLFLSIVMLKEQMPILELHLKAIETNRIYLEKLLAEGVLLPADLDQLDAKAVETKLQINQTESDLGQLCEKMNRLTGLDIQSDWDFILTDKSSDNWQINRQEISLINQQQNLVHLNQKLLERQNYPRIAAFGQAGYGRPGLNFLSDQWDTFFLAGINFSWNLWDWKKTSKQKALMGLQSGQLENEKQAFLMQLDLSLIEQRNAVKKLNQSILGQIEVIELYGRIVENSNRQLAGGTLTMNSYLQNLNSLKIARQQLSVYKVQMAGANKRLQSLTGN